MQEQYKEIEKIKCKINDKLAVWNGEDISEIYLLLQERVLYNEQQRMVDNQLFQLKCLCSLKKAEEMELSLYGIESTVLNGIKSLEDVEYRYLSMYFGMIRLETEMPQEYYNEIVNYILDYDISGIVLAGFIKMTKKREQNYVKMSHLLKERGEYVKALIMLQAAERDFSCSSALLKECAECWLRGKQYKRAYEYLMRVEEADEETKILISELEKII